jgi:hypothetical protein
MGPQPLSRVKPGAQINFDASALLRRPELAVYPMAAIARWSIVDQLLAEMLMSMLKSTDLSVGMAMFQALTGGESKRAALLAGADEAFGSRSEENCLFKAVLKAINPSRNRRNDFAHHMWGTSKELPDALLLVDPKIWVRHNTAVEVHAKALKRADAEAFFLSMFKPEPNKELDRRKIQVFRKRDLEEDAEAARASAEYTLRLSLALKEPKSSTADAMWRALLNVPPIRQEFRRLTSENAPAAHLQRHLRTRRAKR